MSQSSNASRNSPLEALRGRLIVSCQASEGDPLDDLDTLTRIATSVLRGGAGGLRAEGVERIAAFRAITQLPVIGIIKACDANGDVYITPDFRSAKAISDAGADIVALDCTVRRLTAAEPWPELIRRILPATAVARHAEGGIEQDEGGRASRLHARGGRIPHEEHERAERGGA